MSFSIFKQLHAPTGVEHCVSANLTHSAGGSKPPDLVLVKEALLEIWAPRESKSGGGAAAGAADQTKLELVGSFPLHGSVASVAVLKRRGDAAQRDALLLAVPEAKLAVVEFDRARWALRTSSLHAYENVVAGVGLLHAPLRPLLAPHVIADPLGRCAGVLLPTSSIALLEAATGGAGAACIAKSYCLELHLLGVQRVVDAAFMHGYAEPALVVLHEAEPTWSARLAIRRDTYRLSVHSLNLQLRRHPVLWSVDHLPSDAFKVQPVPQPIGGVVVICANAVLYYNQGCSLVLATTNLAQGGDKLQGVEGEEASMRAAIAAPASAAVEGGGTSCRARLTAALDASRSDWLCPDSLAISTKSGVLLVLSLLWDGHAVTSLSLNRVGSSVLSSAVCGLGTSCFFLGSCVGDSLLIRFRERRPASLLLQHVRNSECTTPQEAPAAKRARGEVRVGASLEEVEEDEEDELHDMLYSSAPSTNGTAKPPSQLADGDARAETMSKPVLSAPSLPIGAGPRQYELTVLDSFAGIGPVRDLTVGDAQEAGSAPTEIVVAAGHGKNGGLAVLQGGVFPDVIREVELPGVQGVWAVHHQSPGAGMSELEGAPLHEYLILSMLDSTMVLKSGTTLSEVTEQVEFVKDKPTLAVANLFDCMRIVQVHPKGVRLLAGEVLAQDVAVSAMLPDADPLARASARVLSAHILDPFILLHLAPRNRQVLLVGDPASRLINVSAAFPHKGGEVTAAALYADTTPASSQPWDGEDARAPGWMHRAAGLAAPTKGAHAHKPAMLVVCRKGGVLEMYSLPDMKLAFRCTGANQNRAVLEEGERGAGDTGGGAESLGAGEVPLEVVEVRMEAFNNGAMDRPMLALILNDGTLVTYKATLSPAAETSGDVAGDDAASNARTALRFVRMASDWVAAGLAQAPGAARLAFGSRRMARLDGIRKEGAVSGIVLTGANPMFLVASRGTLRTYSVPVEGGLLSITSFHNTNCPFGFIYTVGKGSGALHFSQLPARVSYTGPWPMRRVLMRCSVHAVVYQAETKCYVLAASHPTPARPRRVEEGDVHAAMANSAAMAAAAAADGREETFEIRVVAPGSWGVEWRTVLEPGETALCLKAVHLKVGPGAGAATRPFIVVGTGFSGGEDVPTRGRILLLEVTRQMTGPNQATAQWSGRVSHAHEFKGATRGPVTAVAGIEGHLIVAIGSKLMVYLWTGEKLDGCAFFDAPMQVVSMTTVKNFVLLGDVLKSVFFLHFREDKEGSGGKHLLQLAKDFESLQVFATEFLIDGNTLSLLVSDSNTNLYVFAYDRNNWQGQKLLTCASFHLGSKVGKFVRRRPAPIVETGAQKSSSRTSTLFGTAGGSMGCVSPLDEQTFRRLQAINKKLALALYHTAGLNPLDFRSERSLPNSPVRQPAPSNMMDGELLCRFMQLELADQFQIARSIGTTREQVIGNLRELAIMLAPCSMVL